MKTQFALIVSGLLISCNCALGQKPGQAPPVANPLPAPGVAFPRALPDDSLTRFDLDFPGGTPEQLVRSIEKASGKPVNVVIPPEHADVQLPKLKMKDVTVPQLFAALGAASTRTIAVPDLQNFGARNAFAQAYQGYGFETLGNRTDDSIWSFHYTERSASEKPRECKFYQLGPYLETFKVEDITTAIQTGWKMLGETNPPTISYHKDTKLLIAVGDPYKLLLIDQVLSQLPKQEPTSAQRREAEARALREGTKGNFAPAEK